MTADQFVTVVRQLPLTTNQAAAVDEALAGPATKELPRELIRREILTEYQTRAILAGRAAELTIGRYIVLDEVGSGGMGTVFKARDTAMDRVVALKLIRADHLNHSGALPRFQQEIRAVARLSHPNIVRAYDTGTADGKHFLVTEFVNGHDLGRELERRGALPAGEACEYARQAAVGLQHAFEQGLTHRDIKPGNLLYDTTEKVVKIADFGLARLRDTTAGGLTVDGAVMGTPDYIAPEQARSATAADIRSDLYSLGCTLYHFLTGHTPFEADTAIGKMVAHANEEPPPLSDSCPGLTPDLAVVVTKLMAKDPADRYQSPAELVAALVPFCPKARTSAPASRPPSAAPASASGRRAPSIPPPLPPSRPPSAPPRSRPAAPAPSTMRGASQPTAVPLDLDPEPEPKPAPRQEGGGSRRGLLMAGGGLIAVAAVAAVVIVLMIKKPEVVINNENKPNVTVNVPPVNVTVKIDDWPKAREPGVVIFIEGAALPTAEKDKPRTADDLKAALALPPGSYKLVLKKDGKEVEVRTFDVAPDSADKTVATRPVAPPKPPDPSPKPPDPVVETGEVRRWGTAGTVTDLAALPDGQRVVSLSSNVEGKTKVRSFGAVHRLDAGPKPPGWELPYPGRATTLARQQVAVVVSSFEAFTIEFTANVYSLETGGRFYTDATLPSTKTKGLHTVTCVGAPDGERLLWSSADTEGTSREVILYTVVTLKGGGPGADPKTITGIKLQEKNRFPGSVACFDPSGNRVLVADDRGLTLWSEDDGKTIGPKYLLTRGEGALCVAVAPDGKRFAAGGPSGTVSIWNFGSANPVVGAKAAVGKGHAGKVTAVGFSADGKYVVSTGEDGTVRVWNATTGKEVHQFKHDGPVYALAMAPGGKRVFTGGADKTVRLWQLPP